MARPYRGRLAPSPTGKIHFGTARTSLVAWLAARSAGGALVMRLEDLDPLRVVTGAATAMLDDLRWLGLDWDEGPDVGGACGPYTQSERSELYEAALEHLDEAGRLFPCTCSRKEVAAASSAPHGELGARYPGTCRPGPTHPERSSALRFIMEGCPPFTDRVHGAVAPAGADDFVVKRSDGLYAYQLAAVVDDMAMGITQVVRGDDLLGSTGRQLALYDALGGHAPDFAHVPLVLGADDKRLSKRDGSIAISDYRHAGWSPERVVGSLASSLGWIEEGAHIQASELVAEFDWDRVPDQPSVWHTPP